MWKWITLAFLAYAAVEIALVIEVGRRIGLGWVLAWVIVTAVLGLAVLRTQGVWALRQISLKLQQEILPTNELVDLALVVLAAALLISPGFLADLLGLILFLPVSRLLVRHLVFRLLPGWLPEDMPDARLRTAASNVIEIERDPQR